MNNYIVLGKNAKTNESGQIIQVPTTLKAFSSKWERNIGDVITFENEKWMVMSSHYDSIEDAQNQVNWQANHYVQRGWWRGNVSTKSTF